MTDLVSSSTTNRRRQISASLSAEASEQWQQFCAAEGVSISALIEALGEEIGMGGGLLPSVIADARAVDSARRRRRVPQT